MAQGDMNKARARAVRKVTDNPEDRNYLLGKVRVAKIDLADGQLASSKALFDEVYDVLRTQGINADNTVASVAISEDIKFWKGEPFEQAMAFSYVAVRDMVDGDFGNARAAAEDSLFLLKDFGDMKDGDRQGKRKETVEIASSAPLDDPDTEENETDQYFDNGYVAVETDFSLGYLLAGVANKQLGRVGEAADHFQKAAKYNPELAGLARSLNEDNYNMLLVADYGIGPVKMRYGDYNAFSQFLRWVEMPSDSRRLEVLVDGERVSSVPAAVDLNQLARDHKWNNMEDVRVAKGRLGDWLIHAGANVAAYGAGRKDDGTALIGALLMVAGWSARENAKADVRYLEVLPQRVFVVPLRVNPGQSLELRIAGLTSEEFGLHSSDTSSGLQFSRLKPASQGLPESRLVLPDAPAVDRDLHVVYARIPFGSNMAESSGRVLYTSDWTSGQVPGDGLPWILGGRCVRRPSAEVLAHYHSQGNLLDLTLADLEALYRDEGIALSHDEELSLAEQFGDVAYRHVLDGGRSLVPPAWGSVGFLRVFCNESDPYRPRTEVAKRLAGNN